MIFPPSAQRNIFWGLSSYRGLCQEGGKNSAILSFAGAFLGIKSALCRLDKGGYPPCYVEKFSTHCGKTGFQRWKNKAVMRVFHTFNRVFNSVERKCRLYGLYNAAAPSKKLPKVGKGRKEEKNCLFLSAGQVTKGGGMCYTITCITVHVCPGVPGCSDRGGIHATI